MAHRHTKPADDASVIPLAKEARTHIPTAEAARHLGRRPQTMRIWASTGAGVVTPIRVGTRLMWPVSAIKAALGGA